MLVSGAFRRGATPRVPHRVISGVFGHVVANLIHNEDGHACVSCTPPTSITFPITQQRVLNVLGDPRRYNRLLRVLVVQFSLLRWGVGHPRAVEKGCVRRVGRHTHHPHRTKSSYPVFW